METKLFERYGHRESPFERNSKKLKGMFTKWKAREERATTFKPSAKLIGTSCLGVASNDTGYPPVRNVPFTIQTYSSSQAEFLQLRIYSQGGFSTSS